MKKSLYGSKTRSDGVLKLCRPIPDPRGGYRLRNETSFDYTLKEKNSRHYRSLYGQSFVKLPKRDVFKAIPYPDHFAIF